MLKSLIVWVLLIYRTDNQCESELQIVPIAGNEQVLPGLDRVPMLRSMFTERIEPGFYDTDALGHINNTRIPMWFEHARQPVFRAFVPDLSREAWNLIIARIEVDYHAQLQFGQAVEIRSWISKIGRTSFHVSHDAWQQGVRSASGSAVFVHYDYQNKATMVLTTEQRSFLADHLLEKPSP